MLLANELTGPTDAPELVLIHGITESLHSWRPVTDLLQEDHRVLAVDLRGHGESGKGDAYDPVSYAADVVETAAAAGFAHPIVIGHSLGGVVATAYSAAGGTCRAIIDVDQSLQLSAFKEALSQLEPLLRGTTEEFLSARSMMFEQMDGPLPGAERARVDSYGRPAQDVVLGTWAPVFDSTADELDATIHAITASVRVPFLSLHGIDPGPHYDTWLSTHIPSATVEIWGDHGHYPHLVDPARFVARLGELEAQLR